MTDKDAHVFIASQLFYLLLFLCVLAACAHPPVCATATVDRTFVQLWRDDARRSPANWNQWFLNIDHLGFEEIIVQWSSYDDISFHVDARPGVENAPTLAAFIKAAARHRKRIWLGLDYDPRFWQSIAVAPSGVEQYLSTRLAKISERLPRLLHSLQATDTSTEIIRGWYISDEIDDINWKDSARQKLLFAYLKDLRSILRKAHKDWPVLISGFSNGACPPDALTGFWNSALNLTGIDGVLFQDGVGAGKLTLDQLEMYLKNFHANLVGADHRFGVIVELFQFTQENESTAAQFHAAPFSRVSRQISIARQYSALPITVFSAPDYLKTDGDRHSRKLYRDWKNDRSGCD